MDRWLRWTVALAVFAIVFGTSLAVAGTVAEPAAPEDSPALFGTQESLPGDRGMYKTALVVVKDGKGQYFDMNARYAFERLDDRLVPGPDGALVPVASFVGEWRTAPFRLALRDLLEMPVLEFPDCWPTEGFDAMDEEDTERWVEAMEACGETWGDVGEEYGRQMEAWGEGFAAHVEQWSQALDREFHTVEAMGWHVTHHDAANRTVAVSHRQDGTVAGAVAVEGLPFSGSVERNDSRQPLVFTEPLPVPGPCGWRTSLQSGPDEPLQDMWQPITVHGACPPDMELGFAEVRHEPGPVELRVSGRDRFHGQHAVVFSMPEEPDRLRLWFTADAPYPVRILTRTESVPEPVREMLGRDYRAPAFYVLHELIEFEPGHEAPSPVAPEPRGMQGAHGQAGPELGGFAHPWPVAAALADAADPAKAPQSCRAWRDWAAAHPSFQVRFADMAWATTPDPRHADPKVDEAWALVAVDGEARRTLVIERHTETVLEPPLASVSFGPSPLWPASAAAALPAQPVRVSTYACAEAPSWVVETDVRPEVASSGQLPTVEAAAALLADFTGTLATGYGFRDVCIDGCDEAETWLSVGRWPAAPGGGTQVDILTLGPDGGLRQHVAATDAYPDARFSDPAWDPAAGADPWGFKVAGSGVWSMPQPATAATLAGAGAAVGGLFLLWPALKAVLAALPMFSRIRDEDLLEHPLRMQIHQVVEEQPGIHFQEMVRRVGKGRGTTEHHLRKLVAGGLLVEKAQRGFTCYFPKGRIDRQLMAAAPLLKSDGARQILHALHQQPGSAAIDVAQRLGMATSTVNYHVKKLGDAGLVDAHRDGRFLRLSVTGIGEQALGQFGST